MSKQNGWLRENKKWIALCVFLAVAIAVLCVSAAVLDIPIVAVGALLILETLLSALLSKTPIFVHGVVLILQIVAGFLASKVVFMILLAVVYIAALVVLSVFLADEKEI